MARAPSKTSSRNVPAKQSGGSRAVTDYAAELERQAELAAGMEKGAPMGRNFSFKGGQMMFDGAPVKDNKVVVIVAGAVIEKSYYAGAYDPDTPEAPVCFAFDTDPETLAPNPDDVADLQNESCGDCPWNQFGSADRGKGKACKDVRRLALIPAGTIAKNGDIELFEDPKAIEKAEFGFAKLPPTSLTPYAAFVRQTAQAMKRPPHGIYALMECVPDSKNQFVISWEALDLVDNKVLPAVMSRHEQAMEALVQPYTYPSEEEAGSRKKPSTRQGKPAARQQAKTSSRTANAKDKPRSRKY